MFIHIYTTNNYKKICFGLILIRVFRQSKAINELTMKYNPCAKPIKLNRIK